MSSKEPAKVFDRLYQEKGLKTLFGRNAASGPSITLKDIQFSRKGELKLKETTIQGPRYDPGSIASPKIVNYWINSSKENVPQSPKSFELSRGQHQFSGSSRGPVIAKPIAIKISENFTTHEAPRLSRNNSQVMCPEPEVVKNNETQGQTQESCEPYQRSNQVYIQDVLNNREILRDSTNYYPELTEGSETTTTLKPTVREMAAEKLKMLQRELAMHNNDIPEEDEEDVTPYQPTLLKAPSDLKAPLNIIDEVGECSSAGPSRKQSRSSVLDNQPVHFHYYIQTGL